MKDSVIFMAKKKNEKMKKNRKEKKRKMKKEKRKETVMTLSV